MDIYLVRVRQRSDKSLYVEYKPSATTQDNYIAISHVWGNPLTIQRAVVDGVDGLVALSPGKKDILNILRRKDICGEGWFWMDLFCIDQRADAEISISQQLAAIPAIYKSSCCVKVLAESPVCDVWQSMASGIVADGVDDREVFAEEELRHSRRCPNMLFYDPWFERLWTRQEGLYGQKIEVILLNRVPCARQSNEKHTVSSRWLAEGSANTRRSTVELFLADKLAYHGFTSKEVDKIVPDAYLDFVYRHRLNVVDWYGGVEGPHPDYSPIQGAWESERETTKARDYVLAVFPDMTGYRVPPNPRKMSFEALLADALDQTALQQRYLFTAKFPRGMLSSSAEDTVAPWMPQEPTNVAEALDGILAPAGKQLTTMNSAAAPLSTITTNTTIEHLIPSEDNLAQILGYWRTTTDTVQHISHAHPAGPCAGSHGTDTPIDRILLLRRYLVEQFSAPAINDWGRMDMRGMELRTAGRLTFEKVRGAVSGDVFKEELCRFLVCLLCGVTQRTADTIRQRATFVVARTPLGDLLALINSDVLAGAKSGDFALRISNLWRGQGLLIAAPNPSSGYAVVGRTAIPKELARKTDG